jgi:aconitate hydratase
MGIVPLEFLPGENADALKLTGEEVYDIVGLPALLSSNFASGREVIVRVTPSGAAPREIRARVRIDTPQEILYYQNGGILQFVLRQLSSGRV